MRTTIYKWSLIVVVLLLSGTFIINVMPERIKRYVYPDILRLYISFSKYIGLPNKYNIADVSAFFGNINLAYPGLEKVKTAVSNGDYKNAIEEYLYWREKGESRPLFFDMDEIERVKNEDYTKAVQESVTISEYLVNNKINYMNTVYHIADPPNYFPKKPLEDILMNSFEYFAKHLGISYLTPKFDTPFSNYPE